MCKLEKMNKQKRVVKVETHKFFVIRPTNSPINCWCDECCLTVPMVTPERAAVLMQTTPRIIYRQIENGELHFIETDKGDLFVCCRCLEST